MGRMIKEDEGRERREKGKGRAKKGRRRA